MKQKARYHYLRCLKSGSRCPFLFAQELMPIAAGQMYIEVNNLCPYIITNSTGGHTSSGGDNDE